MYSTWRGTTVKKKTHTLSTVDKKQVDQIRFLACVAQKVARLSQNLNTNAGLILSLFLGVAKIKRMSIGELNQVYLRLLRIDGDLRKVLNTY